jgi:quercetin dioxygenase-like cupin family protein
MSIKLSGKDTGGRFAVMEDVSQPKAGPPLHVHHREDETFYVLEGEFTFEVDGRRVEATEGDFVFAPRGLPHRYQNRGTSDGRLLITVQPAGLDEFFEDLSRVDAPPSPENMMPVFAKHGLELLGPPLS